MEKHYVHYYLFLIFTSTTGYIMKIDSENILNDMFIEEINIQQQDWKAGNNFDKNSELKNLISIKLKTRNKLELKEPEIYFNITEEFDSREHWPQCESIRDIYMQGNCASSYALVPAAVFQDRLCIQKNISRTGSADQLLTCCRKCGGGCFGGYAENSFKYIKEVGLVTGGNYGSSVGCRPYRIANCKTKRGLPFCEKMRNLTPACHILKCTNRKYIKATYENDKLKMQQIYALPSKVESIKSEIIKNGPVSALMTIYEDFFTYKSGIYHHTSGTEIGQHYVKLIGWGITKISKQPYWLVINSWGKKWGNKGTFKIRQGVNECDIESNVLSASFT